MKIYYDDRVDLLYLRFEERKQEVENRRVTEDIVLDLGEGGKIVGIEILGAPNMSASRASCPSVTTFDESGEATCHQCQGDRGGRRARRLVRTGVV